MNTVSRRTLLRGTFAAAALAGAAPALAACGNNAGSGPAASSNAGVKLPAYIPLKNGPVPDLAPTSDGVLAGFLKYPENPISVTSGTPGDGSTMSAFVQTYSPVAPALGQNTYWQALNKALGVSLDMQVVPASDYNDKLNALVAGSSLPDMVMIRGIQPNLPDLLKAEFADLSELLAGDAVKEYPLLANLPTVCWKTSSIWNNGIYGVPIPRAIMGSVFYLRADLVAAKGLNPQPGSYAEFEQLCKELTDAKHNVWAITTPNEPPGNVGTLQFIMQMLGVPNNWKLAGGKLTKDIELAEVKEALAKVAGLWKSGYIHPDSFETATSDLTTNYKQWFNAGSAVMDTDNYTAWPQFYVQNVAGSSFKIGAMLPPNYDSGTKAVTWQGNPSFSFTAFKKASTTRLKALLKVVNWMAAPFGSSEYLLKNYGISPTDWTRPAGGDVTQTNTGADQVPGLGVGYVGAPPYVLYYPGEAAATTDGHAFESKWLPLSVADPTLGLYSKTYATQQSALNGQLVDAQNAILRGQQPVSSWDDAVKSWRSGGGDKMRGEFEDALAKSA